jgi:hypothetical protein
MQNVQDLRERVERRLAKELGVSIEIVRREPLCQQLVDECMDEMVLQHADA